MPTAAAKPTKDSEPGSGAVPPGSTAKAEMDMIIRPRDVMRERMGKTSKKGLTGTEYDQQIVCHQKLLLTNQSLAMQVSTAGAQGVKEIDIRFAGTLDATFARQTTVTASLIEWTLVRAYGPNSPVFRGFIANQCAFLRSTTQQRWKACCRRLGTVNTLAPLVQSSRHLNPARRIGRAVQFANDRVPPLEGLRARRNAAPDHTRPNSAPG